MEGIGAQLMRKCVRRNQQGISGLRHAVGQQPESTIQVWEAAGGFGTRTLLLTLLYALVLLANATFWFGIWWNATTILLALLGTVVVARAFGAQSVRQSLTSTVLAFVFAALLLLGSVLDSMLEQVWRVFPLLNLDTESVFALVVFVLPLILLAVLGALVFAVRHKRSPTKRSLRLATAATLGPLLYVALVVVVGVSDMRLAAAAAVDPGASTDGAPGLLMVAVIAPLLAIGASTLMSVVSLLGGHAEQAHPADAHEVD